MSDSEDSTPPYPPHGTLFGMLQRGRGRGFLRALEAPREEVWSLLVDCVLNDPRVDTQSTEDACDYYAELMVATRMPMERLLSPLRVRYEEQRRLEAANDTDGGAEHDVYLRACKIFSPLAKLGVASAFDLLIEEIARGHHWGWRTMELLEIELDAERLSRLEHAIAPHLSSVENLDAELWVPYEPQSPVHAVFQRWRERHPRLDAYLLEEARRREAHRAEHARRPQPDAPSTPEALKKCLDAIERSAHDPTNKARVRVRRGIWKLSRVNSDVVIERARTWFDGDDEKLRDLGESLLRKHANEGDHPRLRSRLASLVAADPAVAVCRHMHPVLDALARLQGGGPDENYERILMRAQCPNLPGDAAEAMAANDPDGFRAQFALECLWDADVDCKAPAIEHADTSDPRVVARLRELSNSPLLDEEQRSAARARLASAKPN